MKKAGANDPSRKIAESNASMASSNCSSAMNSTPSANRFSASLAPRQAVRARVSKANNKRMQDDTETLNEGL